MCSGQLTPPCPKPICGLATLASLSERGGGGGPFPHEPLVFPTVSISNSNVEN